MAPPSSNASAAASCAAAKMQAVFRVRPLRADKLVPYLLPRVEAPPRKFLIVTIATQSGKVGSALVLTREIAIVTTDNVNHDVASTALTRQDKACVTWHAAAAATYSSLYITLRSIQLTCRSNTLQHYDAVVIICDNDAILAKSLQAIAYFDKLRNKKAKKRQVMARYSKAEWSVLCSIRDQVQQQRAADATLYVGGAPPACAVTSTAALFLDYAWLVQRAWPQINLATMPSADAIKYEWQVVPWKGVPSLNVEHVPMLLVRLYKGQQQQQQQHQEHQDKSGDDALDMLDHALLEQRPLQSYFVRADDDKQQQQNTSPANHDSASASSEQRHWTIADFADDDDHSDDGSGFGRARTAEKKHRPLSDNGHHWLSFVNGGVASTDICDAPSSGFSKCSPTAGVEASLGVSQLDQSFRRSPGDQDDLYSDVAANSPTRSALKNGSHMKHIATPAAQSQRSGNLPLQSTPVRRAAPFSDALSPSLLLTPLEAKNGGNEGQPKFSQFELAMKPIVDLARLSPTDIHARNRFLTGLYLSIRRCYPDCDIRVFGSFACPSVSVFSSDIDVAVSNVTDLDYPDSETLSQQDRLQVITALQDLYDELNYSADFVERDSIVLLRQARIPLLEMKTKAGIEVDVSIGDMKSADTRLFAETQAARFESFAPLVVFLKTVMAQHGRDKPYDGYLGSFKLYYLVALHLQRLLAEGERADDPAAALLSFYKRYGDRRSSIFQPLSQETVLDDIGGYEADFYSVFNVDWCVEHFVACHRELATLVEVGRAPADIDADNLAKAVGLDLERLRTERQQYAEQAHAELQRVSDHRTPPLPPSSRKRMRSQSPDWNTQPGLPNSTKRQRRSSNGATHMSLSRPPPPPSKRGHFTNNNNNGGGGGHRTWIRARDLHHDTRKR